jgi:hypothetical protein
MRVLLTLFCLAVVLIESSRSAEKPRDYLGSIASVSGRVQFRESASGRIEELTNANYRPIYEGSQLKCETNGLVTLYLKFGVVTNFSIANCSGWTGVKNIPARILAETRAVQGYQETNTLPGGRTRGGPKIPRRALLVGIDQYRPLSGTATPSNGRIRWDDLDGCVNDVQAMQSVLVGRMDFNPADVVVLTNAEASRSNILARFESHLIRASAPGDIAFFYYAGHGSQIPNSKSKEADRMDETIVPADSAYGGADIRDKELRRYLNAALDRGALLTTIFDSCHSGSITRGAIEKARFLPPGTVDVADGSDPGPNPRDRNALVFSAALDTQLAHESRWHDRPHGAFSAALLNVLSGPSVTSPVNELFLRVRAVLHANCLTQEPLVEADPQRLRSSLLGLPVDYLSGQTLVAVQRVNGKGEVILEGGQAIGLVEKCELVSIDQPGNRLKITAIDGIARSTATVIQGSATIKAGDLFRVDAWFPDPASALRLWIPDSIPLAQLADAQREASEVTKAIPTIADPVARAPESRVLWTKNGWAIRSASGVATVGPNFTAKNISQHLSSKPAFLEAPPSSDLADALRSKVERFAILAARPEDAHFCLVGRFGAQGPEYSWIAPNITGSQTNGRAMPAQTAWVGADNEGARTLGDYALRLSRVRDWLCVEPAESLRSIGFPYELTVRRKGSKSTTSLKELHPKASYELVLQASPEKLKNGVPARFVYVLLLDSSGQTVVLFPKEGAEESQIPPPGVKPPSEILLNKIEVVPPFGVDNYILVVSKEPLPDPFVLNSEGVQYRTRGAARSGLENLLFSLQDGVRGAVSTEPIPKNWSMSRLQTISWP